MTSARYEFWNDSGYTESGVERPPIGSTLADPDFTYTQERPNRDDLFDKVSVKGDYVSLMNVSYLRVTYDFNESDPIVIYGWVDSVSLRSDTEDFPMTDIRWHCDLWRTYASQARLMAGTVRRRPYNGTGDNIPPQPYPYRYLTAGNAGSIIPSGDVWWVYVNYVYDHEGSERTTLLSTCFPVHRDGNTMLHVADVEGSAVYRTPTLNMVMMGILEECYGVDPESMVSACISPIPPCTFTGDGSASDPYMPEVPFTVASGYGWGLHESSTVYGSYEMNYFQFYGGRTGNHYEEYSGQLSSTIRTTDTKRVVIKSFDGSTVGALPWGFPVRNYTYRMVNAISSQYIQIRFDGVDSYPEGVCFTIPLPMVSVTTNSWSSYVYSGQREYDIQMRNAQSDQELQRAMTSAVEDTVKTMAMATMFQTTSVAGKAGVSFLDTVKGKTMGQSAGASASSGVATGLINYGFDKLYFNNEYQKWEDYASAHQTDNILLPGDGFDYIYHGTFIGYLELDTDAYSQDQRAMDISMYGAHVTEPMTSCQALVNAGGPLQITNMTVRGDIPVEAKEYIRAMFSNGVRLI